MSVVIGALIPCFPPVLRGHCGMWPYLGHNAYCRAQWKSVRLSSRIHNPNINIMLQFTHNNTVVTTTNTRRRKNERLKQSLKIVIKVFHFKFKIFNLSKRTRWAAYGVLCTVFNPHELNPPIACYPALINALLRWGINPAWITVISHCFTIFYKAQTRTNKSYLSLIMKWYTIIYVVIINRSLLPRAL